jgi:hypothetical protein
MKLEGLILDKSDIQVKEKTTFNTGEVNKVGLIRLITTYPTQTVDVHVSVELMKDPKTLNVLHSIAGTRTQLSVEYKEMSFANSDGKHVAITGFHLFELPQAKA